MCSSDLFSRDQLVEWFDLEHVSRSPAQFDPAKLRWMNHQYMKTADDGLLARLVGPRIEREGGTIAGGPPLEAVVALLKDRAETLNLLAESAMMFYRELHAEDQLVKQHLTEAVLPALRDLQQAFSVLGDWSADPINAAVQEGMKRHKLKMPAIAIPLRVAVFGLAQTPSLAHVLALAGRKRVLDRLGQYCA